jgi:hypothetical protein
MVVGLHGYAQSGKDTVAKVLIERYGFKRLAFADALREALYRLNPWVCVVLPFNFDVPKEDYVRLRDLVDTYGWDEAKQYHEVRVLLQAMGTEVGREVISDTVWIDIVLRQIEQQWDGRFVITDVRFENEAQALDDAFGNTSGASLVLAKIVRPGVGPVNAHVSDAGLPDFYFDETINNDGTLEDLGREVTALLGPLVTGPPASSLPVDPVALEANALFDSYVG